MESESHRKRGFFRRLLGLFFGFIFGLSRLVILTVFVMALTGWLGYTATRRFIKGETTAVPLVAGKESVDALEILGKSGLHMELDHTESDDDRPAGFILDQHPAPDTVVKVGTAVRVILSSGPELIGVPDLRLLDYKEAEVRLIQADLAFGLRSNIASRSVPSGAVVTTDPPPQSLIRRNSPVNLLISIGPPRFEIAMPNLLGTDYFEAADLLERLGLRHPEASEEYRFGAAAGYVIDQFPAAGVRVAPSSEISVIVSAEEQPQGGSNVVGAIPEAPIVIPELPAESMEF